MNKPWFNPGKWYVSPYNFADEIVADFNFPKGKKVRVVDSTLREMETLPGLKLKIKAEDILEIAAKSDEIGCSEVVMHPHLYAGTFTPDPFLIEWRKGFEDVAKHGFRFKLATQVLFSGSPEKTKTRANAVIDAGSDVVEILSFVPPERPDLRYYHLAEGGGVSWEQMIRHVPDLISYLRDRGVIPRLGIADAGKNDFNRLLEVINKSIEYGLDSVIFYDATACFSPEGARYFMKKLRQNIDRYIGLITHFHESLGQSTMNTVGAVTGGADVVDVAMNLLEYRCGLANMPEVVCCLEMLYGVSTGIRLDKLYEYSKLVERQTKIYNHPMQPIVGEEAHLYEFSSMITSELRDRMEGKRITFMPYAPEVVGNKPKIVWGANSIGNTIALETKLQSIGLKFSKEDVEEIRKTLEKRLTEIADKVDRVWLTDLEVENIALRKIYKLR